MRGCNEDVTVWNGFRDTGGGIEQFVRHVIPVKCKWRNSTRRDVSSGVATTKNSLVVIVPYSELYMAAQNWRKLDCNDKAKYFTLQNGDLIALGNCDAEISKTLTKADVKELFSPHCMEVTSIQDNTSSQNGRHYRIEGVLNERKHRL